MTRAFCVSFSVSKAQIRGSRVARLQGQGQVVECRLQAVRPERGARRHDRSAEHQVQHVCYSVHFLVIFFASRPESKYPKIRLSRFYGEDNRS